MKILVIADHHQQTLQNATYHTLKAALALKGEIDLFIIGHQCQKVAETASTLPVKKILLADHEVYAHELAENTAPLIAEVGKEYDYILMSANTHGKNILPRVAALLEVDMVSDVIAIENANQFVRPIYAGNALETVELDEKIKLLTIRSTAFKAITAGETKAPIEPISIVIENTQSRFENQTLTKSDRPELTAASIVIAGGRGLKSAENFKLIENLADCLGAAVGASRAAVDAGFVPNDYQVGQTGKVVAPKLYIAIGISGAIQHVAGMKDSKVIVAINNDPDAPIFQIADYGLVGDLFEIVPELCKALTN
jgi:electron transfer flavoprotein alpha subunit